MSIKLPLDRTRSFTRPLPADTTITSPSKTLLSRTIIPTSLLVPTAAVPQTQSYPTSVPSFPRSTHTHSPLPPPREIQCLPNPAQSVISKKPNVNQQGHLPSDPQDPRFKRVVQYIDQLIADPTPIFRCPHLRVEAHNTMNKDCT